MLCINIFIDHKIYLYFYEYIYNKIDRYTDVFRAVGIQKNKTYFLF